LIFHRKAFSKKKRITSDKLVSYFVAVPCIRADCQALCEQPFGDQAGFLQVDETRSRLSQNQG
jgi:hypothetical protein